MKIEGRHWVDVNEVSRRLSIPKKTLYTWAEQGMIPSYKIHGLRRFNMNEIEKFMENHKSLSPEHESKKILSEDQLRYNKRVSGQKTRRNRRQHVS